MSSVSSVHLSAAASAPAPQSAPATADMELAKYESQLSDWVNCASSKTAEGKAKIAEITDKIDAIKARMKLAQDARPNTLGEQAHDAAGQAPQHRFRLDQLGAWMDAQA